MRRSKDEQLTHLASARVNCKSVNWHTNIQILSTVCAFMCVCVLTCSYVINNIHTCITIYMHGKYIYNYIYISMSMYIRICECI